MGSSRKDDKWMAAFPFPQSHSHIHLVREMVVFQRQVQQQKAIGWMCICKIAGRLPEQQLNDANNLPSAFDQLLWICTFYYHSGCCQIYLYEMIKKKKPNQDDFSSEKHLPSNCRPNIKNYTDCIPPLTGNGEQIR